MLWRPQIHVQLEYLRCPNETGHVTKNRTHSSTQSHPCCKGAIAGGFKVSTVKVDRDGAIVLYSRNQEREECEEPRLPPKANEWDEVLKK
jgi:hypothetical protein